MSRVRSFQQFHEDANADNDLLEAKLKDDVGPFDYQLKHMNHFYNVQVPMVMEGQIFTINDQHFQIKFVRYADQPDPPSPAQAAREERNYLTSLYYSVWAVQERINPQTGYLEYHRVDSSPESILTGMPVYIGSDKCSWQQYFKPGSYPNQPGHCFVLGGQYHMIHLREVGRFNQFNVLVDKKTQLLFIRLFTENHLSSSVTYLYLQPAPQESGESKHRARQLFVGLAMSKSAYADDTELQEQEDEVGTEAAEKQTKDKAIQDSTINVLAAYYTFYRHSQEQYTPPGLTSDGQGNWFYQTPDDPET